jgi:hypothetical protein
MPQAHEVATNGVRLHVLQGPWTQLVVLAQPI